VSQTQASNHLADIEANSLVTRDETIKTDAKLKVHIGIVEKKN